MLHADQRVAKYALRIWGSRCLTAKIAGETTVGLTVTTRKTIFSGESPDLAVEAQEQQHDEEQDGPQGRQGHHGHSFGVSDEGQAGTWKQNIVGMGGKGSGAWN